MSKAKKVTKKKKRKSKKGRRKSRAPKKVQSKLKSDPKAPPRKIKIKSSKAASMAKEVVQPQMMDTKAVAPADYEHIYNADMAKQNPEYVGKVKENLAAGVPLAMKAPAAQQAAVDPLENVATKYLAPEDYCHIYNAKECLVNGVKVSLKAAPNEPIEPPPIEIAPILPDTKNPTNAGTTTVMIAPDDYVPIYNAKNGAAPPPSPDALKRAVNERLEKQNKQAGPDNE